MLSSKVVSKCEYCFNQHKTLYFLFLRVHKKTGRV